jgi:ferritin-like metal-binding protein YciE
MPKRATHNDLLDGIKENVESTNRQIYNLQRDLDSLAKNGTKKKRQSILQKLSTLDENLQLLRERWMHAVNPESTLEHPLAKPEDLHREQ